jgi:hypothetical protein
MRTELLAVKEQVPPLLLSRVIVKLCTPTITYRPWER